MSDLHPAAVGPQPDHTSDQAAPPAGPSPELVAMHGLLSEALAIAHTVASMVPTASAAVAQFADLRARFAKVLDPPKT
ncbi:MAG: hypothetical protein V4502_11090 [Pseudomonadota bacterium]